MSNHEYVLTKLVSMDESEFQILMENVRLGRGKIVPLQFSEPHYEYALPPDSVKYFDLLEMQLGFANGEHYADFADTVSKFQEAMKAERRLANVSKTNLEFITSDALCHKIIQKELSPEEMYEAVYLLGSRKTTGLQTLFQTATLINSL